MLHKSFTATLSNSTDAHTSPYPLSFSPPLSSSLLLLASCCTRQQLHASLANYLHGTRRSKVVQGPISNLETDRGGEKSFPSLRKFMNLSITRFNFQFKLSLEGLVNFFDAHLPQLLVSLIKSPPERMSRMFSKSPIRVTSVSIRPTTTTRPNKRRHNSSH